MPSRAAQLAASKDDGLGGREAISPSKVPEGPRAQLVDLPEQKSKRFVEELEFLHCLANPKYVRWLAVQGYLKDEAFLNFLKYLSYWRAPPYLWHVRYPQALRMLELMQCPSARRQLHSEQAEHLLTRQMMLTWADRQSREVALPLAPDTGQASTQQREAQVQEPKPAIPTAAELGLEESERLKALGLLKEALASRCQGEGSLQKSLLAEGRHQMLLLAEKEQIPLKKVEEAMEQRGIYFSINEKGDLIQVLQRVASPEISFQAVEAPQELVERFPESAPKKRPSSEAGSTGSDKASKRSGQESAVSQRSSAAASHIIASSAKPDGGRRKGTALQRSKASSDASTTTTKSSVVKGTGGRHRKSSQG